MTDESATPGLSADEPIKTEQQDDYDIAPFCGAMAEAIAGLDGKSSFVIALNGPWGVGKSSAVNITKEKLAGSTVTVLTFNPWGANGLDDLAWEFLGLVASQLDEGTAKPIKTVMRNLRRRGKGAASAVGGWFGAGAALLGEFTWQKLHEELAAKLNAMEKSKRFLIIVDDIDRLDHDQIFEVFRLIKTIGHLPRVSYLLVFDEGIATSAIEKRYQRPGEGAAYLEKIVQVSFVLPMPSSEQLIEAASKCVDPLRQTVEERARVEFENMLHELISPTLSTPRDIARLSNHIAVAWPPVRDEVSASDFMGLQALKAFYPAVFGALPENKLALTRTLRGDQQNRDVRAARFDRVLGIDALPNEEAKRIVRNGLQRLFPVLQGVWSNMFFGNDFYADWRRARRVCTAEHFDSYFRLAPGAYALPIGELRSYRENATDTAFLRDRLTQALAKARRPSGTRASLVLEELTLHASEWPLEGVEAICFVAAEMADQLDVVADEERGFSIGTNALRVRWLLNEYLARVDDASREAFLRRVIQQGALGFAVTLANSMMREHERPADEAEEQRDPRVSEAAARDFITIALARIGLAAANGSLLHHPRCLLNTLHHWSEWANPETVRTWVDSQLQFPGTVSTICEAVTRLTWSQGLGLGDGLQDHVARGTPRVDAASLSRIMNFEALEAAVRAFLAGDLSDGHRQTMLRFEDGVRRFGRAQRDEGED